MMSSPTSKISCITCNKKFASLHNLCNHQNLGPGICKTEINGGTSRILCSHCSKTFSSVSALNLHIRNIHKIKHYSRQLTMRKEADKILCTRCGKALSCISSLNKHNRKVHKIEHCSRQLTPEKVDSKILCTQCGKVFSHASSLNKHIRNIHKIERCSQQLTTEKVADKILCPQCGKAFSCTSSLNKHIRNIHKIEHYSRQLTTEKAANKIFCTHCGKAFSGTSSLNKHIRNIHKIKHSSRQLTIEKTANDKISRAHINCNQCNKTFASSSNLRRHQEKFHGMKRLKRKVQKKLQGLPKNTNNNDTIGDLPANFHYTIHSIQPRSKSQFIKVNFPITHIDEMETWLQQYCECNKIFLKKCSLPKPKNNSIVFKKYYGCGHKVKILRRCHARAKSIEKHTNCPFHMMLSIFKQADDTLLARIRISSNHNHVVGGASSVKFRHVSDQVRDKFLYLFSRQYTPVRALRTHSDDLKEEYGDEYYRIQGDRYYMPDLQWVYYLHRRIYKDDFAMRYGAKMLEILKKKAASDDNVRLKIMDSNNFILSIVTPFMLRVHEEILQSKEMVFIDSTGTMDLLGYKILVIFTNSFSGGLPLGIIITTTETTEAISNGLEMVRELISEKSFGGRGKEGPILFMTGDSQAERDALHNVFPEAHLLLCQFHILQAIWCYVWNNNTGIRIADRMTIFSMFKSLIYESDEIFFEKKVTDMLQNKIVLRYPTFQKYLQDVLTMKKDWASCFRNSLMTRGQNTNNLCEPSMRIIKEVILNQCRAYSPVELLKIVTTEFQDYYIDKLHSIANRHMPDYLRSKFAKLSNKISDTVVFHRAASKVISKKKEYFIDFETGLCSCIEGIGGKLCEHLLVALKDSGVESHLTFPENEEELKSVFYIAEGRHMDNNDNWFKPLCVLPANCQNIEVTDQIAEPIYTIEEIIEETIQCEFDNDSNVDNDLKDQQIDAELDTRWLQQKFQDISTFINNNSKDPVLCKAAKQFIHTFEQISHSG